MKSFKENLVVILASVLLFLITVTAFFPGEMSPDSLEQYQQALSCSYSGLQPPIMSFLWHLLLRLWDNPGILFLFHNLVFWPLWCLLSIAASKDWKARLAIWALALVPSLWSQLIVVWKDTELSLCVLGAYVCLILWRSVRKERPGSVWLHSLIFTFFFLFFFYGSAVRFNSFPALVPLAWLAVALIFPKTNVVRKLFLLFGFLFLNFGLVHWLNQDVFKQKMKNLFQMIQIHDLVGISVRTGTEDLIPSYWRTFDPSIGLGLLRTAYLPESLNSLWTGDIHQEIVPTASDQAQLDELRGNWWKAIQRSPGAYLQHRWAVFNSLVRIGKAESYYPFHLWKNPDLEGIRDVGDPALRVVLKRYFWTWGNSIIFKGWFYLLLALVIMVIVRKGPAWNNEWGKTSFYSALSALLYGCGYFFYAPAADFRFLYPTVTLTILALILLFASRYEEVG